MSEAQQLPEYGSIESAMDRFASHAPKTDESTAAAATRARSVGRREYDLALSRRLEQIRTAQGYDAPPEAAPRPVTAAPPAVAHARIFGARAIFFTALVSALAGASLMWLAIQHVERNSSPATMPAEITRQTTPLATASTTAPPAVDSGEALARGLVERWRDAWSKRDVETYLSCYGSDFIPADGKARSDWSAARRKNISSRHDISVQVRDFHMTRIDDRQSKVVFLQDYAAGGYRESAQAKTLLLTRSGDDWRIAGEWLGDSPTPLIARRQE